MNKIEAKKATRNGAIAALISALMTTAVVSIAIFSDSNSLALWNSPLNYIDAGLVFACAYGIYKKSRVASVLLFVYFIFAKIIIGIETQSYSGIVVSFIFLYFYGKAIQGAFAFHALDKKENNGVRKKPRWVYIIGIPFILLLGFLMVYGVMSVTGVVPSTRVVTGNELSEQQQADLLEIGVITSEDEVKYFYSEGLFSLKESGSILTSDSVIAYYTDENNEVIIYKIPTEKVANVQLESQGDSFNSSVYMVNSFDQGNWLRLFLSIEQKGDEAFINSLNAQLE